MSADKELLKKLVAFTPRERRLELENLIDNEIRSEDIKKALLYVNKLNQGGDAHYITQIGYSPSGDFFIFTQTGMTFLD